MRFEFHTYTRKKKCCPVFLKEKLNFYPAKLAPKVEYDSEKTILGLQPRDKAAEEFTWKRSIVPKGEIQRGKVVVL